MNWPTISLVLGVGVAISGAVVVVLCQRAWLRTGTSGQLRGGCWLLAAALLGAPLSYVPWPVVFDDGSPGHTVQWVGVPVPMIALLGYNGQQGIHPALHIFAWILNGAFASGVAHGVAYLRCARSPEPSRPS